MTPAEALKFAEKNGAKFVDFKFVDLLGIWQHTTMPIAKLAEDSFTEGFGFDGSSIRGWKAINESDMVFIPDSTTAVMDPFYAQPTLSLICDIVDAVTRQPYSRDPRYIARKAEQYLKQTGIGDTAYFGPEPEFFIFDDVRFSEGPNTSFYAIDSSEGRWNAGNAEGPNLGYKPAFKGGYFPVPPDRHADRHPQRDVAGARGGRHPGRGAPPRGGQRRSVRAVDALQLAGQDGRLDHVVQVHRQEHRPPPRQGRDVHAEADLRRQRLGDALPPVDLEGREEPLRR